MGFTKLLLSINLGRVNPGRILGYYSRAASTECGAVSGKDDTKEIQDSSSDGNKVIFFIFNVKKYCIFVFSVSVCLYS